MASVERRLDRPRSPGFGSGLGLGEGEGGYGSRPKPAEAEGIDGRLVAVCSTVSDIGA